VATRVFIGTGMRMSVVSYCLFTRKLVDFLPLGIQSLFVESIM